MWLLFRALITTLTTGAFLGPLLKRVAVFLGLSVITYAGVAPLMTSLETHMLASWASVPTVVVKFLQVAKIPEFINIILGAYGVRLAMLGLDNVGALKRVILKPGQQGSLF